LFVVHRRAVFLQFLRAPPDGVRTIFHQGKSSRFGEFGKNVSTFLRLTEK
jgi:hypothetical protein